MALIIDGKTLSSTDGTSLSLSDRDTNWLNVSSNGIMTQKQRPYMRAVLSGQGAFYRANTVTFGLVLENVGSCWNNTTGRFTCPVAGRYLVGMSAIGSGSANATSAAISYGYLYILKNDVTYHFTHWNHTSYWEYVNLSGIVDCNAGDSIKFMVDALYGYVYADGGHGNFFITLLR